MIPQWIISSDKAAYHPWSNTIYLTKWKYLFHELGHWFFYKIKFKYGHKLLDRRIK